MSNTHFKQTLDALAGLSHPQFPKTEAVALAAIQAQATLALAYEQRTANLIALWADPKQQGDEMSGINYGTLATQIKERLGL